MKVAGFPTSSDIYLEVDGKRWRWCRAIPPSPAVASQTVEAFGEDEPVATIPGQRTHINRTDPAVRHR